VKKHRVTDDENGESTEEDEVAGGVGKGRYRETVSIEWYTVVISEREL